MVLLLTVEFFFFFLFPFSFFFFFFLFLRGTGKSSTAGEDQLHHFPWQGKKRTLRTHRNGAIAYWTS